MSVRINYKGNIGNGLFQYVYARLLAERNNFYLETPFPYQTLLQTSRIKDGKIHTAPKVILKEPGISKEPNEKVSIKDIEEFHNFYKYLEKPLKPGQYVLDGYFEYAELFNPYEELIKSFFQLDNIQKNTDDIVVNVRLGDFCDIGRTINNDWYLDILEKEKFNRLYIVGGKADDPYLEPFSKYKPVIVPTNPVNDFHFIRKFDKIICSNSTFCWWAAFLSEASRIYVSDKWLSPVLTSCKNSITIKAGYLKPWKSSSNYYAPSYYMISLKDKLKLELDKYIRPENDEIYKMLTSCLKIIYDDLRTNHDGQPFTLHLNVGEVYEFSMVLGRKGHMLSSGASFLADTKIYFADWKSFHDWIFYGLREMQNQYLLAEGIPDIIASRFNFKKYFREFTNLLDEFTTMSQFAVYSEISNLQEKVMALLKEGAIISLYDLVSSNSGEFYIFFYKKHAKNRWNNLQSDHQYKASKFYSLKEINPESLSTSDITSRETLKLFTKLNVTGVEIQFFRLHHKKYSHISFTLKDSFRVFDSIQADYLILDPFIVESRLA